MKEEGEKFHAVETEHREESAKGLGISQLRYGCWLHASGLRLGGNGGLRGQALLAE